MREFAQKRALVMAQSLDIGMLRLRSGGERGQDDSGVKPMLEQDITARLRATIEEELGGFRPLADLPATEIEAMAARIARAVAPLVGAAETRRTAA
jgi:hypothetical protein